MRDDIYSGSPLDPDCPPEHYKLSADAKSYIVIDTNIVLHQVDLLEHPAITDVIIPSVVLEEVKARNKAVYDRLRNLISSVTKRFYVFANEHHRDTYITALPGETPNDRNDRAIRSAAAWYGARIPHNTCKVILLTDDAGCRAKALEKGLCALSSVEYATELAGSAPELQDVVAQPGVQAVQVEGSGDTKRRRIYEDHKPMSEITAGIKAGRYHVGSLRVSRFNSQEAWVGSQSVGQDILISGREAMNRAMDGDIVAIEVLAQECWGNKAIATGEEGDPKDEAGAHIVDSIELIGEDAPTSHTPKGIVVGILRRSWRSRGYCGSLAPPKAGQVLSDAKSNTVLFYPVERKYPAIKVQTRQAATLSDKRIVVSIDSWEADSLHPTGHYVKTLGVIGDKEVETEVLIIENDINTSPFTPAVHACVPHLPWLVTEAELQDPHRIDLRHLNVCSVDPPGCKDIDDALHIRVLPGGSGNVEVGVHIADVTHFLHPDTAMDEEAARRATTVYLVQRRIDMLPKPLTEDICSLRADVDRLAFSVIWELTPDGDIINVDFTKSVIRSRASLTYAEAQAKIDDKRLTDSISVGLRDLNALAKKLRKRRIVAGALQLASPEVKFEIDTETHDPLDVGMYQVRDANQMVEEMMLLANCTVAEKTLRSFPTCALLRRHPTPAPRQFEPLLRAAAAAGVSIDTSSSKGLATSLDQAIRTNDPYFNKLIRIMATRCMTQAVYISSGDYSEPEYHHYGLAAPLYTHFTSPIRRYADVMAHRVLMAALGLKPLPEAMRDREGTRGVVDNLNVRHRNAQLAGRASVDLHTLIFFKGRPTAADARIVRVRSNGFIVFVPKYGIEGPVYLDGKNEQGGYDFDEEAQTVLSKVDGSRVYTIFDPCAVSINIEEGHGGRRTLVLALVSRESLTADEMIAA